MLSPIRKKRKKERQEKQARKAFTMLIAIERLVERELIKQQWANFNVAWSSSTIKEV